ncbi:MAG: sulfurtransferase [Flavobacteriales bacterium]|nr:sulfurtransferase [Flavobacteriales bacterium]|tara:strand:- start:907 stop:1182 length:276 start_codon:yes stop_codon:yes gene_type:complete
MTLQDLINNDKIKIIDVRTEEEFSEGNVNQSVNIPLHEIPERIEELKEMQPIVLCCRSGQRSGKAMEFLKSHGLKEVYNGGGWLELVELQK